MRPALLRLEVGDDALPLAPDTRALLLSRAWFRGRVFDLSAVPAAQRRAALRAQLLAWAPFDDTDFLVALQGLHATAYAWDRQRVRERLDDLGLGAARRVALWPETLWQRVPAGDGVRCLALEEGVEAQAWSGGRLVATRWWPQAPTAAAWSAWARALSDGLQPPAEAPMAQAPDWLAAPAAGWLTLDDLRSSWTPMQRLIVGSIAVAFTGLGAAQLRDGVGAWSEGMRLQDALAQQKKALGPVVTARDQALTRAAQGQQLAAALDGVQPLRVLQHLADRLSPHAVTLREFELAGDRLVITVEPSTGTQRAALVRDLQAGGWFDDVAQSRAGDARGGWMFEMRLNGLRQPPAAGPR